MIDRLDEILKKFVSVFLFPIVNLICFSLLFYWSSKGVSIGIEQKLTSIDISQGMFSFASEFLKSNSKVLGDALRDYKSEIGTVGYFVAAATTVFTVLAIYLLDRSAYYLGYFLPPNIEFNVKAYAAISGDDDAREIAVLHGPLRDIFGAKCRFPECYKIIRSYLGERNADPQRLAVRGKLVQRVDATRTVFCYLKAYCYVAAAIFVYASFATTNFVPLNAFVLMLLLMGAMVASAYHYAASYRRLVDYDIASFVWERSYKKAVEFDRVVLDASFSLRDVPAAGYPIKPWYLQVKFMSRDEA